MFQIVWTSKKARTVFHNSKNNEHFTVSTRQASTTRHTHGRDVNDAVTGTTTTQAARRGIWNGARVSMEGTTNGRESGTRTVKAGPRGHDDSVSHSPWRAFYQQTRWRFQRFSQLFKGLDTNSCLFKETHGSEACEPMSSLPLGPTLTAQAPDSRSFIPSFLSTLLPVSDVRCSTRVVVVPRGGVVDVAATLVVLWGLLFETGKSGSFCELRKICPCLFGCPKNLEHVG